MKKQRRKSKDRKREIVQVVLDMLEKHPVEGITTRDIARVVGVSQPAIYRHFLNRDLIFEAVISFVLEELEKAMIGLFQSGPKGLEKSLQMMLRVLSDFPGLPKLFFYYLIQNHPSKAKIKLSQIKSMLQNMVSKLIQDEPGLSNQIDGQRAAAFLVALIQGTQLSLLDQNDKTVTKVHFRGSLYSLLDFWLAGLKAGEPALKDDKKTDSKLASPLDFLELDVRPDLKKGIDPFDRISESLDSILPKGILVLLVPFEPKPLEAFLRAQNYGVSCVKWEKDWLCIIDPSETLLDLHDQEAPTPLEQTLEAAAGLPNGRSAWFWLPKEPHLLFPHLERQSIKYDLFSAFGAVFLHLKKGDSI